MEMLKSPNLLNLSILMFCLFLFQITSLTTSTTYLENTPFSFNFSNFDPNTHDIIYEGNAYASNYSIQLTPNGPNQGVSGRATYRKPLQLWDRVSGNLADFTTHFCFSIDSNVNDSHGDGFAFFLAPNGSQMPPNSGGAGLGLDSSSQPSTFVAIEFDTYSNVDLQDKEGDHIGIDVNSTHSFITALWPWSNIENGRKVEAWITYSSSSRNLSVYLIDGDHAIPFRNSSSLDLVIDLRDYLPEWITFGFSGAIGNYYETHNIYSWDFNSTLQVAKNDTSEQISPAPVETVIPPNPSFSENGKSTRKWVWVVSGVSAFILVLGGLVSLLFCFCWKKRGKEAQVDYGLVDEELETGPKKFSYKELVIATNNFSHEGLLGEGGFGKVYLGFLREVNTNVAVKKIKPQSRQGIKEYISEVRAISRLRHRNLVQLIGWCHEKMEFLIVYEFMPNKSLDFHLFKEVCILTWEKRYKVAQGLASALLYLQEECIQCVLHRDIKSSNVLLDLNFNAKLGDFGLARLVEHGKASHTTSVLGTEGFMSPEYKETNKASKESDVYSFGVVALQLACAKPAVTEVERNGEKFNFRLVEWVWEHYRRGNLFDAVDSRLYQNFDEEQMERLIIVGLACANPISYDRPLIREVIDILNFKAPLPVLPLEVLVPPRFTAPLESASNLDTNSSTGESQSS